MQLTLPAKAQQQNPVLSTPFTICTPLPCIHSKKKQGTKCSSGLKAWQMLKMQKVSQKVRHTPPPAPKDGRAPKWEEMGWGLLPCFTAVALPARQNRRCHFEPTFNLWNSKPIAQGSKRWIAIKGVTWTLKEVCQQRNWKLKAWLPKLLL